MSAVCILAPVMNAAWPAFRAAVMAAATSLGYQVTHEAASEKRAATAVQKSSNKVELEIERSEVVTNPLNRNRHITIARGGIAVTFSRDTRGKPSVSIAGEGHSLEELRLLGEELSHCVVQQYVYQKLMDEMRTRGFNVVEEEINEDRSIRLKVRHWEN